MKYVDKEFEESYMIVTGIDENHLRRVRENLRVAYVLSGIGIHHAFNVEKTDLEHYIENDARPCQLTFLTPNHPMHPYNHIHTGIKTNAIHTVYSKCRHHWQSATVEDLVKLCDTYPEKLETFDENGWLPIHYAVYHNSSMEVVEYLISKYTSCLQVQNDEVICRAYAVYWGHEKKSLTIC